MSYRLLEAPDPVKDLLNIGTWGWKASKAFRHSDLLCWCSLRVEVPSELLDTRHWPPAAGSQSGSAPSFCSPPHQPNTVDITQNKSSAVNEQTHPKGWGQRSSWNSRWWAWRRTIFTSETAGYFGLETDVIFTFCTTAFFTFSTKLSKPQSGSLILHHYRMTRGREDAGKRKIPTS